MTNDQLRQQAIRQGIPVMEEDGLTFLQKWIQEHQVTDILEVGTGTGYSSIVMARLNEKIRITTLEKDPVRYQQALTNIEENGLSAQIRAICIDAREYVTNQTFDLIFLDGAKTINGTLLERFYPCLRENGWFVIDDVDMQGFVAHPETIRTRRFRTLVRKLTRFRHDILQDNRFIAQYISAGDGLIIAQKKNNSLFPGNNEELR